MRTSLLALMLGSVVLACRSSTTAERAVSEAERVVDGMVASYNRHDADATTEAYAADARFYRFPDELFIEGSDSVRSRFQRAFSTEPAVHVAVSPRVVHGRFVVDNEIITGRKDGKTVNAVWIYEVKNGKIAQAWVLPE